MSSSDSLTPKTHPRIKQRVASYHTTEVIAHQKAKRGCHGNVPKVQGIAWALARGGQGGQPPTLEKIRVGMAHPGNINRGLKTFRQ